LVATNQVGGVLRLGIEELAGVEALSLSEEALRACEGLRRATKHLLEYVANLIGGNQQQALAARTASAANTTALIGAGMSAASSL